jgi:RNA-binding protein 39
MKLDSPCVLLKNMFDPDLYAAIKIRENEENWEKDLEEDVLLECKNYGKVRHIAVDRRSAGYVYLKFDTAKSAHRAIDQLQGRFFAKRKVFLE